jgi:hypothetical protein
MQPGTGKGSAIDKRLAVLANRTVSVSMGGTSSKREVGSVSKTLKRSMSVDSEMKDVRKFVKPREEPKKPGYCENCRIKYDDFKTVSFLDFTALSTRSARKMLIDIVFQYSTSSRTSTVALL